MSTRETPRKATLVFGEDWQGLYLDGKLAAEGHRLNARDVLDALGIAHESFDADNDWLCARGDLPVDLDEVER